MAWRGRLSSGLRAVVYMPKGSSPVRAQNIRRHGAECTITELNYDDTVRLAAKTAREQDGFYSRIPPGRATSRSPWIMQGYMTLAVEIWQQLAESGAPMPTHLFLQAGVGSFAGSIMGYFIERCSSRLPPSSSLSRTRRTACIARQPLMTDCRTASAGICQL
ncbi:pyridoxal-phosphate dependent enzyme [Klebsiella pneumoniae]|nr:pyridoxal-phosphate dependent enzyme [Klebsiella pneumoniae]